MKGLPAQIRIAVIVDHIVVFDPFILKTPVNIGVSGIREGQLRNGLFWKGWPETGCKNTRI